MFVFVLNDMLMRCFTAWSQSAWVLWISFSCLNQVRMLRRCETWMIVVKFCVDWYYDDVLFVWILIKWIDDCLDDVWICFLRVFLYAEWYQYYWRSDAWRMYWLLQWVMSGWFVCAESVIGRCDYAWMTGKSVFLIGCVCLDIWVKYVWSDDVLFFMKMRCFDK